MRLFRRAVALTVAAFVFLLVNYVLQVLETQQLRTAVRQPIVRCELPQEFMAGMETVGIVEYSVTSLVLAAPMPKHRLSDQQRPPCDSDPDLEVEAVGGCWIILGKKPPCGKTYEFNHPTKGALCLAPKKAAVQGGTVIQREP